MRTSRQTNGATANSTAVGGIPSTVAANAVPVATVRANSSVASFGLHRPFAHQAHSIGTASGFAPATQNFVSPMIRSDVLLGENSFSPIA